MAFAERNMREVFLFLLCIGIANGIITATPQNAAVVAGNWMSMECRTTNGSFVYRWAFIRPNSSDNDVIFMNHDGRRKLTSNNSIYFGVDMDESCSGSLYSNTTRLEDAGSYVCRTQVGKDRVVVSAHLTVLESKPLCETNFTAESNMTLAEGNIIWMKCSVNFRGMWSPTVEWKRHIVKDKEGKEDRRIVLNGVTTTTTTVVNSRPRVTSTLIYVSGSSKATYFSCRFFFQWHNGSVDVTATNLPSYTYIWESPRLIPHRPQLETTEEVYAPPLPVEVRPLGTTTEKSSERSDWYVISLIFLFAVLVFVSILIGLGIRRYVPFRRAIDVNMVYNASTSSTAPLRRLERSPSIEYDISRSATPNIYERIDGADAEDDVTEQATTSYNNHPPLKECYSGLMYATGNATCQYDTLDRCTKMDLHVFNPETDPAAKETPGCPDQETEEERYTTPVTKREVAKPSLPSGSSDYLQMVGDARKSKVGLKPLFVYLPEENIYPKDSDDYLQPGAKALDN